MLNATSLSSRRAGHLSVVALGGKKVPLAGARSVHGARHRRGRVLGLRHRGALVRFSPRDPSDWLALLGCSTKYYLETSFCFKFYTVFRVSNDSV